MPRPPAVPALDLSFVSSDFVAAVVLRPRELLTAPLIVESVSAPALDGWARGFALDPREVDLALILAGTPHAKLGPATGLVLHSHRPLDRKKVIAALAPAHDEVLHFEKTYLCNRDFAGQSLHFADDRTLVVAQQVQLERMLRAGGEPSPLVDRLRATDPRPPLVAILAFDPIRELVLEEVAHTPRLPPPYDAFESLPEHLAAIELHLDPAQLPLASVAFEGRDIPSGARLEPLVQTGLALARGHLRRGAGAPGGAAAPADPFRWSRDGRRIVVTVGLDPPGARQLVSRSLAAGAAWRRRSRAIAEAPEGPPPEGGAVQASYTERPD